MTGPETLDRASLSEALRSQGLRVTTQRLEVYQALVDLGRHATPEEVLQQVRTRQPSISFNTVYETLETLRRTSAIRRGDVAAGPLRYDANTAPHHHLVCRQCGAQEDVECIVSERPCLEPPETRGFVIEEAAVTFFGLCGACKAGDGGRAAAGRAVKRREV